MYNRTWFGTFTFCLFLICVVPAPLCAQDDPIPQKSVLHAAGEVAPFSKTGGLGDVAQTLPPELASRTGLNIAIATPLYGYNYDSGTLTTVQGQNGVIVDKGGTTYEVSCMGSVVVKSNARVDSEPIVFHVYRYNNPTGIKTHFFRNDALFGGRDAANIFSDIYISGLKSTNGVVFASFNQALAHWAVKLNVNIVHTHDWHTGMVPFFLSLMQGHTSKNILKIHTIHNGFYEGLFELNESLLTTQKILAELGIPKRFMNMALNDGVVSWRSDRFPGRVNFMLAALNYADIITSVSQHYAIEMTKAPYQMAFYSKMYANRYRLGGVVNGIGNDWDPRTDPLINHRYSMGGRPDTPDHLDVTTGKARNKADLQKEFGLKVDPNIPIIGIVSRLTEQKGFDVLAALAEKDIIPMNRVQIAVLGTGESKIEAQLNALAEKYPNFKVKIQFSEKLAHLVTAGSDFFAMPSRWEPCGLNQLYSLRYGTLPIVTNVGGLGETIQDNKTGFVSEYDPKQDSFFTKKGGTEFLENAFRDAITRALDTYYNRPAEFAEMRNTAMREDFSWHRSVNKYLAYYEALPHVRMLHKEYMVAKPFIERFQELNTKLTIKNIITRMLGTPNRRLRAFQAVLDDFEKKLGVEFIREVFPMYDSWRNDIRATLKKLNPDCT